MDMLMPHAFIFFLFSFSEILIKCVNGGLRLTT